MFGPWLEIYTFLKSLVPTKFRPHRPHFNFITLHYIYIISLSLMGSVILYGAKNMRYVDALFFGSGAATQSGLNVVDLNDLETYQTVTIMLIACIASPIFINTFVVFIRLYWFEKRFQTVVLEAQRLRRTRERSRGKHEGGDEESRIGVAGHDIDVVRPGPQTIAEAEKAGDATVDGVVGTPSSQSKTTAESEDSDVTASKQQTQNSVPFRRDITFADEPEAVSRMETHEGRMPSTRSPDEHIAILEKQRDQKGKGALYIPGPRDFDRGHRPRDLEERSDQNLQQSSTRDGLPPLTPATPEHGIDRSTSNEPRSPFGPRTASNNILAPMASISEKLSSRVHFPSRGRSHTGEKDDEENSRSSDRDEPSPVGLRHRGRTRTFTDFITSRTEEAERDPMPYLSYQPTIGRNSAFVNLSEDQREELGGIEYRALKLLATVLCFYYVGFHTFGMLSYLPWIMRSGTYKQKLASSGNPPPGYWGVFTSASMFNDLGFTLTPDSMMQFQYAVWILLIGSFLIIIGNTGFPCMLRFVIWIVSKVVPRQSALWEEFRFLLDHPRRCFTLLFPSTATWWLFWILVLLNLVDLIFFIILDLNDPVITQLPVGTRLLDGWFQAASTRTAGFAVVNLADLHPGIQVSYLIMMYISVFPIAISVRRTNVYEEKSLGVYNQPTTSAASATDTPNEQSYVGAHLRRQLSFDLWYVFLGLFIISICEGSRLSDNEGDESVFTLFAVLFEVVSAYGTVGLSLGYPNSTTSFSAQFGTISKLVIIAMQIRGRHRGLPYALDKAVLLPSEGLQRKEEEEAALRKKRRESLLSKLQTLDEAETVLEGGATGGGAGQGRRETVTAAEKTVSRGSGLTKLLSSALSAGPTFKRRD